jgi:hypothetical protein
MVNPPNCSFGLLKMQPTVLFVRPGTFDPLVHFFLQENQPGYNISLPTGILLPINSTGRRTACCCKLMFIFTTWGTCCWTAALSVISKAVEITVDSRGGGGGGTLYLPVPVYLHHGLHFSNDFN